jgi:hypothetical protein
MTRKIQRKWKIAKKDVFMDVQKQVNGVNLSHQNSNKKEGTPASNTISLCVLQAIGRALFLSLSISLSR